MLDAVIAFEGLKSKPSPEEFEAHMEDTCEHIMWHVREPQVAHLVQLLLSTLEHSGYEKGCKLARRRYYLHT